MGLLRLLRRLFFGGGADTAGAPTAASGSASQSRGQTARQPVRLSPLRHQSGLVRTDAASEISQGKSPPYLFAHRDPRTGVFLDLSKDADPRWLEYYGLPALRTPAELAEWLGLPVHKVAWLTYRFCENYRPQSEQEAHYHFRWRRKRSGGHRLIEAPKQTLREVQQRILQGILNHVSPHAQAHGFVAGRSILTNAAPHVGKRVIVKFDLDNFYPSVRFARVVAIFRSLGYSREVALWLARLTTSAAPASLKVPLGESASIWRYMPRHLPQGAPTSPALANLSAYGLDVRLAGLAQAWHAEYTRYADDLTFSADAKFIPALKEFIPLVQQVVQSERFLVNTGKRRVVRTNQRQVVTGVVVNEKVNVSRRDYDRLKAILHNCVKLGPSTQNTENDKEFAARLRGRIAHVQQLNPTRGAKLLALYQRIKWGK